MNTALFRRFGARLSDTSIDTDTVTRPVLDDGGDHDKFAHYVRKNDIVASAVEGNEVTAICGKKWVPTKVPDGFPVCPDCKKIYDQLKRSG
ncbi:MAG: DUF3039 domain-containing protein [Acidimicrobiales bacterium]|nr:DUF3039 domain-containing protein [Acidimicrobiales bacterium]RZV46243.1 MAG: DUF3039 domain-containing protein [Acidimicrobiales bacterium]